MQSVFETVVTLQNERWINASCTGFEPIADSALLKKKVDLFS
jgi:hypothetical protein